MLALSLGQKAGRSQNGASMTLAVSIALLHKGNVSARGSVIAPKIDRGSAITSIHPKSRFI
jgi:hypothetical protein